MDGSSTSWNWQVLQIGDTAGIGESRGDKNPGRVNFVCLTLSVLDVFK